MLLDQACFWSDEGLALEMSAFPWWQFDSYFTCFIQCSFFIAFVQIETKKLCLPERVYIQTYFPAFKMSEHLMWDIYNVQCVCILNTEYHFFGKMNLVWSALQPFFSIRHPNLQYGLFLIWHRKLINFAKFWKVARDAFYRKSIFGLQ